MSSLSLIILVTHYLLLGILCLYGGHRIYHTFLARAILSRQSAKTQKTENLPLIQSQSMQTHALALSASITDDDLPTVTLQAPIFNERFVVERLIDALAAIEYPKDKLQIQILDDSTDDTVDLARKRIAHHQSSGINIDHIHRMNRQGYKAGALQEALESATGDFVAIFDADFIPPRDFLTRTMPYFFKSEDGPGSQDCSETRPVIDAEIGMVQTRWQHLNREHNLLTRVQSIMLDAHFGIEQIARSQTGAYFNFNGTAGIWRKATISDAGGWLADTLTEDLDLSYRAQLKGWTFKYAHQIGCPSELPVDMAAFKTQQHRWAKGAIEVMKRVLRQVWKSPAKLHTKIEASFHLTGNFSYMLMFIDSLFFLLPAVHIRETADLHFLAWIDIPLFFFASLSHAWFFLYSQKILHGRLRRGFSIMPVLLATSIGLGVNNGRAVIEALIGHVTGFVRTPKTGDTSETFAKRPKLLSGDQEKPTPLAKTKSTKVERYKADSAKWAEWLEITLGSVYFFYLIWALANHYWVVAPFLSLFCIGFWYTGTLSLAARYRKNRKAPIQLKAASMTS